MNVGSLFSGIGGLDEGLRRAGLRHAFLCESDPWRRGVLAERFPGVPIAEDVVAVGLERVGTNGRAEARRDGAAQRSGAPSPIDLLCGGFPCQDLSVAGRRAGLAGERSGLFFEFARVADELVRPGGHVLVENVPGLLSSHDGRDFAVLLATLAELGFHDLAWRVLDSRYFGVPQRRRRVFVLGRRARGQRCAQVLLEPESGGGDFAPGREAGQAAAVASLSGLGSGGPDDNDGQAERLVAAPLEASDGHHGYSSPRGDGADNLVSFDAEQSYHEPSEDAYLTRKLRRAVSDGQMVRRLTPRECERLQGFPDDWTLVPDDAPDSRRYAALGDAVTVPVAEWIGRRLAI